MHYVNTAFDFLVNYLLEKIKYVVIESSYFCIIKKNANKLVLFFFVKDKKLKKLAVALKLYTYCFKFKFECFLLVLFAFKDPSTLYKSSKTRNHLKPGNLGALFLLSALQMPIKSVIGYQA